MHFLQKIRPAFTSPLYRRLIRRHMQLFVGGLSYDTNETVLKDTFENYGKIVEGGGSYNIMSYSILLLHGNDFITSAVKVICDRVSGKSRGYGFVRYSSEAAANKALKEMDGQLLDGRNIRIHYAHRGGSKELRVRPKTLNL
ncbi:hypothetical protein AAHA92_09098 [Salvia divinorum]|uniref:RRM domain-containing protein n=1 Tax=Salvia divinorum TaxID=28513 RepID=A0ABD1HRN9_SALDI